MLQGASPVPRTLTVEMPAAEEGILRPRHWLAVLLELDEHHKPRVLSWEVTREIACVPHDLLAGTELAQQTFELHDPGNEEDCTTIALPYDPRTAHPKANGAESPPGPR